MAVPAGAVISMLDVLRCEMPCADKLLIELIVATYTVGIYDSLCLGDGLHTLRFCAHCKDSRVSQAILCLKQIFGEDARMWYVAIDTRGTLGMRAVLPCGVVGTHDMAVDTYLWAVAQIAVGLGNVYQVGR